MPVDFDTFITCVSMALGFIASMRFAVVMCSRWGISGDNRDFFALGCGVVAAVVLYFVSYAAMDAGGIPFGIIAAFLSIPLVGITWIFVVGGNKALERVLNGLIKKLS